MNAIEIVLLTAAILLIVLAVTFLVVRQLRTRGEADVRAKYPAARLVIPNALFVGQESKGVAQVRGNGTLAVTDREMYFRRWLPDTEYVILLDSIQTIETPLAFLHKSYRRPLLRVNYRAENGQPDAMGWYVPDAESVKRQIEALRGGS